MALSKAEGPFDRLMALSKAEWPFDMLTALSKAEWLRYASSFVTAAYLYVRLIPQDLRALHLDLFSLPSDLKFLQCRHSTFTEKTTVCQFQSLRALLSSPYGLNGT
jgi:hypothetical protein